MAYEVVFSPEAKADLIALFDYIAEQSGAGIAIGYIDRIERYCGGFVTTPERGTRRDDLRPGLRIVGFERRIAIAFHIDRQTVTIDRILYGGRDIASALGSD